MTTMNDRTTVMDDPLTELMAGPGLRLAPTIASARGALEAAWLDLLTVSDAVLEAPWPWRPAESRDADVRYGFYRIHERLETAIARVAHGRMAAGEGSAVGPAVPILAAATAARWDLRAALAALDEEDLDRDPGGGEWSVRRTLGHVVASQRAYGWYTAWWLDRGHAPGPVPSTAGDDRMPELPDEEAEAIGSRAEIVARLDDLVDLAAERFGPLDARALAVPARWSGFEVDVRFRLVRLGSHLREHTIQVDKTAVMLGRPATEVERLVRLIGGSYGRLEGLVFARSADALAEPLADGGSAAHVVATCTADVRELAASVARAAAAGGPAGG